MNTGYIHAEPRLGDYVHGDGKLGTVPLQPDGQWDAFLPPTHQQDENGFEPFDCVTEATINCVETLEIKQYSATTGWARRFLAKNSGTDVRQGNDPQTVSETLRTGGCTTATDYPFLASPISVFYQALTSALKTLAIGTFAKYSYGHSWVNANPTDMMAALQYSPLSAAGYAWEQNAQGYYITPQGSQPEHDFMVYGFVEGQYWKIRDSYSSFDKSLAWDYQFTGVKRHTLNRQAGNTPAQQTAWQKFVALLYSILGIEPSFGGVPRSPLWPAFKITFEKTHPKVCAVCGGTTKVQLHHILPYHINPKLELDPNNVIWLCTGNKTINCHLRFGHFDNFMTKWNPAIKEEAALWSKRFAAKDETGV